MKKPRLSILLPAMVLLLLILVLVAPTPAGAGDAAPTSFGGTLVHPRYIPTATRLVDGRVLLTAGVVQSIGASVLCELNNP
jgi:hypothetical protein